MHWARFEAVAPRCVTFFEQGGKHQVNQAAIPCRTSTSRCMKRALIGLHHG
jgi:hypothetical protein